MSASLRALARRSWQPAALITGFIGTLSLGLIGAPPATAATELMLHDDHVGATAGDFHPQANDCMNDPDEDGWHFVAPGNTTFTSITVAFELAGGGPLVVTYDQPGQFGPPKAKHAFVQTPAGATLTGGSATVADDIQQDFFVLSHTCPGTPTETTPPVTTTPPGESTPPGDESTPPGDESTPPSEEGTTPAGDILPVTGAGYPIGPAVFVALLMLGAGAALLRWNGVLHIPYRRRH